MEVFPWKKFPKGLKYVVGYGSAAVSQKFLKPPTVNRLLDLVFVTEGGYEEAKNWHAENMGLNRDHYSPIALKLGPTAVTRVQSSGTPRIYFNTFAKLPFFTNEVMCKYGVVAENDVLRDLETWDSLYVAGRLQKPHRVLFRPESKTPIEESDIWPFLEMNRMHALRSALLLLPTTFSFRSLFSTIVGLSYSGDIRQNINMEDPFKVKQIVEAQAIELFSFYYPLLASACLGTQTTVDAGNGNHNNVELAAVASRGNAIHRARACFDSQTSSSSPSSFPRQLQEDSDMAAFLLSDELRIIQNCSEASRKELFSLLPSSIQRGANAFSARRRVGRIVNPTSLLKTSNLHRILGSPKPWEPESIRKSAEKLVRRSSLRVALKGMFSSSPTKSLLYIAQKMSG